MGITARPVNFLKEVKSELTKVTWSTRQEVIGATAVVIVITAIMALYIFVADVVLSRFLNMMFR
jgi:preprotein translocase subunit SecE